MFENEFSVLVVDDDLDVLAVTKLALKNVTVYEVPVKVYTAASKAEAVEVIQKSFLNQFGGINLAVAFIDVVMETDDAGLDLCRYIRTELNDKTTQLYIRTGQPGTAPERQVIDEYDINGYFTKAEMTEDKLYSMVKSGIRQFYYMGYSTAFSLVVLNALPFSRSREQLGYFLKQVSASAVTNVTGETMTDRTVMSIGNIDRDFFAAYGVTDEQAAFMVKDALARPSTPLSDSGDQYFVGDREVFIHVADSPINSEYNFLVRGTVQPPDFLVQMMYQNVKAQATLWKLAQ